MFCNVHKKFLSRDWLKVIAFVTMMIDHAGVVFLEHGTRAYQIMRDVGRISFPMFLVLFVDGLLHTKRLGHHVWMLGVFACLSEIPYDLALGRLWLDWSQQNVIASWFIGAVLIAILMYLDKIHNEFSALGFGIDFVQWLCIILFAVIAEMCHLNYGACCQVCIGMAYITIRKWKLPLWMVCLITCALLISTYGTWFVLPAVLCFVWYDDSCRSCLQLKYFYYVGYPLHLILFAVIRLVCV